MKIILKYKYKQELFATHQLKKKKMYFILCIFIVINDSGVSKLVQVVPFLMYIAAKEKRTVCKEYLPV